MLSLVTIDQWISVGTGCFVCAVTNLVFGCITGFIIYCHLNRPCLCHPGAADERLILENKSIYHTILYINLSLLKYISSFLTFILILFPVTSHSFCMQRCFSCGPTDNSLNSTVYKKDRQKQKMKKKRKKHSYQQQTWQLQTCCPTSLRGSN